MNLLEEYNATNWFVPFGFSVRLKAGESIDVKVSQSALVATSSAWITIERNGA